MGSNGSRERVRLIVGEPGLHLPVNRDLLLEFVYEFSRFEYLLKRSGYLRGEKTWAAPDWDSFSNVMDGRFGESGQDVGKLGESIQYLLDHPPLKQVNKEGRLAWLKQSQRPGKSLEALLFEMVRTVRNNLFHGGKFIEGPVEDPARDEDLLRHCLVVLMAAKRNAPELKGF